MAQTRERYREYQKQYRDSHRETRGTTRAFCECGNAATVPDPHGAICERCARLETAQAQREARRERMRNRHGYKIGGLGEFALRLKL